ncbi:ABC transporter ATP-binding protein [Facklamia miroungae]|uniref:ABC-2 type transport system ATP-binding protein n=1 Tax=Facklamia miroungae TaxID=120956 RepID=A0A1G7QIT2_9LACT|nr:ABC transporter ATP-binding protein [Facklamia miroungae]NKZ28957.1 ABC transporter ATP-binding protein [Facklamia miroungae]SDF98433.1 ABC-2 type transport system ATP-binding protein [Facklamia miroungae]
MEDYVIEMSQVSKTYTDFSIENLNLRIRKGYVTGFVGPNGSGKTTIIKMIMGLIKPESGSIKVFGKDLKKHSVTIKEKIGFVYAENYFYDHLTVEETGKMIAPFYKNWNWETYWSYIKLFGLSKNKIIEELSTGMKVELSLAIALSHDPLLIVLDEPTSGLDPIVRSKVLDILFDFIQDANKSVFFSSHIMTDLERIADDIAMIHYGKLLFNIEKDTILDQYKLVKGPKEILDDELRKQLISCHETSVGFEGLSKNYDLFRELFGQEVIIDPASLEEIMVNLMR